jgi:RNA polymerase sigma factor (sigma-70 family)
MSVVSPRDSVDARTSQPTLDPARDEGASRPALLPKAPDAEKQIGVVCERASFAHATSLILDQYGAELRAFLSSRTRNRMSMEEVYSVVSEDLWKGLPRFRFQGRVRSWIYVLARNALARHTKRRQRWHSRHVIAEPDDYQAHERHSLPTRMERSDELLPLLTELPPADRQLLEQRLVRAMPWRDIALERGKTGEAEIDRESARLRKRYQTLVQNLRQRARLNAARG